MPGPGKSDRPASSARSPRRTAHEHAQLVQRKLQQAAFFFGEFAEQMNVIAPRARQILELPGVLRFPDLQIRDLFVEERLRPPRERGTAQGATTSYEYVLLSFHYTAPQVQVVERRVAPEIEKLEALLSMHRVRYELKLYRNTRAQVDRAVFSIASDISAGVKLMPDEEHGAVRFALRNIDRLVSWETSMPASRLGLPLFEELARCVLGQPNEFQRLARGRTLSPSAEAGAKD